MGAVDREELYILAKIFESLASKSSTQGIDRQSFLQFFQIPVTQHLVNFQGLYGDRLFEKFDQNKSGLVEYEEFIEAIGILG